MQYRSNPLEELGIKHGATKQAHNYLQHYWTHLRDLREEVRSVLEIGVQTGASLRMWEEFFPNALIHGIDIDPDCKRHEKGRVLVHIGDQNDDEFLASVLHRGPFDLVVDDGSHLPHHQIKAFETFFPQLSQHGIFVMEDTGGVVSDFNNVVINALRNLTDHVNYWPPGFPCAEWPHLASFSGDVPWITRNVVGVAFYRWLVFVFRGDNPGDNPNLVPKPAPVA
ncbi:class I SAM-dependent methyltransferase [Arenibaculum pallidiluteum]|uniref:class I SAM-dependent methyltransferase n=1 Tax=Arenibaculum pallidiluteum TaxID=2812559 RepID=UPI001A973B16|nr:class I SAM-dependent methyltransferase [Arenibaculum pallidiluteum]